MPKKTSYNLTVFLMATICIFLAIAPRMLSALEIGAGIAAVEQGDDHQRPAALLHATWSPFYFSRFYIYGRDFGPVEERTYNLSIMRRFGIMRSQYVQAAYGLNVLMERLAIDYSSPEVPASENKTENNFNLGASFGIYTQKDLGTLSVSLGWESHIYPAGLAGGIFLSSARKQYISASLAMKLF